jgi:hypothetical protein
VRLIEGNLLSRGIGWYLSLPEEIREDNEELIPHIAGLSVLGLSYAAAGALVAIDGPLPFGDAIAAGIILVPDVVWYGLGYALFD